MVVSAVIQPIAVFSDQWREPIFHIFQQFLVFLVDVEHEILERGTDLLFLTRAFNTDLMQAFPPNFLFALLLH